MPTLPNVNINVGNGGLGRVAESADGTSLLVVSAVAATGIVLNTVLGPFTNLQEVEAAGITKAYDTANTVLAWHHAKDFYDGAGSGTILYILPEAKTVTMKDLCDKDLTYIAPCLASLGGKVKLVIVTRIPDTVGTLANQFEQDLLDAVVKAQALRDFEVAEPRFRPVRFILEGRNFQGNASSSQDFRLLASNAVMVVMSQDPAVAALNAAYAKYAEAAYVGGIKAGRPVQRNIGRVKDGTINRISSALSNGALYSTISDANLETLNAHGLVFARKFSGREGFYYNDSHTCAALTDDFAFLEYGCVMDKALLIARNVYIDEVLDDIEVDQATGKLPSATIKQFEALVEKAIGEQMEGEISGVKAFVNPEQNVISTSKIQITVLIQPKSYNRRIEVTLRYSITLSL